MKKLFIAMLIVMGLFLSQSATAQVEVHKRTTYRYYPDANVYYSTTTHQYAYSDNGNWKWQRRLPSTVTVHRNSYVTVRGDRDDIWRDNDTHREKYKNWGKHKEKDRH